MQTPTLSIVMPALNEEKNITEAITNTLTAFDTYAPNAEVIVINDGSVDATRECVKTLMQQHPERVRLIDHDSPQGIGASFWDGVDQARGDIICMLPGDNENEPGEIFRYMRLLDDVDMVIPFVFNKNVRSKTRNILSKIYLTIINTTFGLTLNYTNGTVLYRAPVLRSLSARSYNFFYQVDILVRLIRRGYLFAEAPYRLAARSGGRSKAVSLSSLCKMAKNYCILIKDIYFSTDERQQHHIFVDGSRSKERKY